MSEDIQKGPSPPRQEEAAPDGAFGQESDVKPAPPYPQTVVAAGIVWIVWGSAIASGGVGALLLRFLLAPSRLTSRALLDLVLLGLGALIVLDGIRFIRRTRRSRDTLGAAISSLVGGFVALYYVFTNLSHSVGWFVWGLGVALQVLLCAVGLSAGILFLCGRRAYQAWWNAEKIRKTREDKDGFNPFRK